MEKGRANLSRRAEAPIAKLIKDILGLWEVDCGIAGNTGKELTGPNSPVRIPIRVSLVVAWLARFHPEEAPVRTLTEVSAGGCLPAAPLN